jgi:hypothetical protein
VTTLLLVHASIGLVALFVLAVAALLHHEQAAARAPRVAAAVNAVAEKVDPGEAPPLGVLSTPEKSRRVSRRFELAEWKLRRGARALTTLARSNG